MPVPLRARPIHITVDAEGDWLLTAYNLPSMMSVHRLQPTASIGEEVKQAGTVDGGVYAHQIRMLPSHRAKGGAQASGTVGRGTPASHMDNGGGHPEQSIAGK